MRDVVVNPGHVAVQQANRRLNAPFDVTAQGLREPSDYKRMAAHSNQNTLAGRMHVYEQTLFDMVLRENQRIRSITLHPDHPPDPFKNIAGDIPLGPGKVNLMV